MNFFLDLWGRIERDTCMTASNCAKYDGNHSLIIFKDHSPLKYTKVSVISFLDFRTTLKSFQRTLMEN